jgi:NADH:quinone reductase (non-electrogenic)
MKAVQFDQYGGVEVLQVVDAPVPEPGQGEALIKVKATSINPGEAKIREGLLQQGRYVGRSISRELRGRKPPRPFRYFDKGNMAVVGKNFAIMESGRIKLAGLTAWFAWAFIHLLFLPQLQNRLRVERQWMWSYFTGQRSSRLVTEAPRIGK